MKTKLLSLIFILFSITSCGQQTFDNGVEFINYQKFNVDESNRCKQCENYQDEFIRDMNIYSKVVKIGFADLDSGRLGVCYMFKDGRPAYIKIDRKSWTTLTNNIRKALIYHELGHCLLRLQHISNYGIVRDQEYELTHLVKLSIMNPSVMTEFQAAYTIYEWEDYLTSLERSISIKESENINLAQLRAIYYKDIKKWEQEKDNVIINERLIYPYICLEGRIIFQDEERASSLIERGVECDD